MRFTRSYRFLVEHMHKSQVHSVTEGIRDMLDRTFCQLFHSDAVTRRFVAAHSLPDAILGAPLVLGVTENLCETTRWLS